MQRNETVDKQRECDAHLVHRQKTHSRPPVFAVAAAPSLFPAPVYSSTPLRKAGNHFSEDCTFFHIHKHSLQKHASTHPSAHRKTSHILNCPKIFRKTCATTRHARRATRAHTNMGRNVNERRRRARSTRHQRAPTHPTRTRTHEACGGTRVHTVWVEGGLVSCVLRVSMSVAHARLKSDYYSGACLMWACARRIHHITHTRDHFGICYGSSVAHKEQHTHTHTLLTRCSFRIAPQHSAPSTKTHPASAHHHATFYTRHATSIHCVAARARASHHPHNNNAN